MSKAIGCCRTTHDKSKYGIDKQKELIAKASIMWKDEIVEWFEQVGMGSLRYNELSIDKALVYCQSHKEIKYLIATDPDTVFRSLPRYYYWREQFEKLGVEIKFVAEDLDIGWKAPSGAINMADMPDDFDYIRIERPNEKDLGERPVTFSVIEDLIENMYITLSQLDHEYYLAYKSEAERTHFAHRSRRIIDGVPRQ